MWAYKSYNDDAPDEDEPRFPPPKEPKEKKSLFSWTSELYNKSKRAPIGKLNDMLSARRRQPARSVRSRRSSFVSSFFSTRRSDHDGRLDKIIKLLELLAEDKLRAQQNGIPSGTRSRTSSRGSRQSYMPKVDGDEDDGDYNDMTDDDDEGDYRQSRRPSGSTPGRFGKSRVHPPSALEIATGAGLEAALQNWRSKPSDGKTPGLQDRLKSSLKAGAIGAGKKGIKQFANSSSGSRRHREDSEEESRESLEGKANPIIGQLPALESMGKDRLSEMLKTAMKGNAKQRPTKNVIPSFASAYSEPGHSRFKKEMLHYGEESPALSEEDLLDGILPPIGRYDFDDSPEALEPWKRPKKRRDDAQEDEIADNRKDKGKSRPLHFDPRVSSSVQAFDWPDKEEISKSKGVEDRTSKGKGKMMVMNDDAFAPKVSTSSEKSSSQRWRSKDNDVDPDRLLRRMMRSSGEEGLKDSTEDDLRHLAEVSLADTLRSRQKSSSQRREPKDTGEDPEMLLRQLMEISGEEGLKNLSENDLKRLTKATRGQIPSPLDTMIKKGDSSTRQREHTRRELDLRPTSQALDESFGIAWPTTPSHEPSDNETLPEYESPTTEAFRLNQHHASRPESVVEPRPTSQARGSPPQPTIGRRDEVLFQRVLAAMRSCLGAYQSV